MYTPRVTPVTLQLQKEGIFALKPMVSDHHIWQPCALLLYGMHHRRGQCDVVTDVKSGTLKSKKVHD
jgi:hypothetical protein